MSNQARRATAQGRAGAAGKVAYQRKTIYLTDALDTREFLTLHFHPGAIIAGQAGVLFALL